MKMKWTCWKNACLNAWWFRCARWMILAVYIKWLYLCMLNCNASSLSALCSCKFHEFTCSWALSPGIEACSRVLFAGRRHGDVTVMLCHKKGSKNMPMFTCQNSYAIWCGEDLWEPRKFRSIWVCFRKPTLVDSSPSSGVALEGQTYVK